MSGAPPLRFELLGSFTIRRGDQAVTLASRQQRRVLAALLVADRSMTPDELIDVLWGERPPATARGTLQTHVSRLRTALAGGPDLLANDASGYRLEVDTDQVDTRSFELLLATASTVADDGRPTEAQRLLTDALALWRGPALSDFRYEPFAQNEIARLDRLRLVALEQHLALELDGGRHVEATTDLETLVAAHPLHEDLHALYITALYRSGRQADALAAYQRLRETLVDELGLDPTPGLRRLEQDILDHDPRMWTPIRSPAPSDPSPPPGVQALRRWLEPLAVPPLDDRITCELLLARGEGQRRGGHSQEARQTYAAAVRLAAATGSSGQLAAGALGLAGPPEDTSYGEPLDEALLERAVLALPDHPPVVTMLRARLAVSLIDRGDTTRGNDMADAAIAFARSAGDPASLAYALRARHRTWFDPAALEERLALDAELIELGLRLDDLDVLAWGRRWRTIDVLEAGDLAAFEQGIDDLEVLAGRLHDSFHWWGIVVRRAGLALLRGPIDKAEPLVLDALALAEQIQSPYTMSASLIVLWALRWQQGRLDEIADAVLRFEGLSDVFTLLIPHLHRELGQRDEAARVYRELAADGFAGALGGDRIGVSRLCSLAMLGDVACYVHATDDGEALHAALAPFAGRLAVIHPGLTAVAPVDQVLGQLSALLGDRRSSESHFTAALALCDRIDAPVLRARTQVAYAESLLDLGGHDAAVTAEALLDDARLTAVELGLLGLDRRLVR